MSRRRRSRYAGRGGILNPLSGINPALRLMRTAAHWYSSKDGDGQVRPNRGTDSGLLTRGSSGAATLTGSGLYLPGTTGNVASAPDSADLDITGDLDLRADILADTYTTGTERALVSKFSGGLSYMLFFTAGDQLRIRWTPDGSTQITAPTVGTSLTNGERYQLRATLDVDDGSGDYVATTYFRTDGLIDSETGWTEIDSATGSASSVFSGTSDLYVGASNDTNARPFVGTIFAAQVQDGIGGEVVASPNFAAQPLNTTGFDDAQGNTWTVNATGVDTNDYTHLSHDGEDYVWFPVDTTNRLTASDAPTVPAGSVLTLGTRLIAGSNIGSVFNGLGPSTSRFYLSTSTNILAAATTNDSTGAGQVHNLSITGAELARWKEVEIDLDNDRVRGRISNTDTTDRDSVVWDPWTAWVDTAAPIRPMTGAVSSAVFFGSSSVESSTSSFYGLVDGVPFLGFEASDLTGWTVGRAASGLKTAIVTRPVDLYDGVDDYGQLPASATPTFTATTGKHTVVVAYRRHGTPTTNHQLWDARASGAAGADLVLRPAVGIAAYVRGADSSALASVTSLSDGSIEVAAYVQDEGSVAAYGNANGLSSPVDVTGVGTIAFSSTPKVGTVAYGSGVNQAEVEVFDILDFPDVALTEEELDKIAAKLKAGTYS